MHREVFTPSQRSVVCSDHFEECWFDRTGQNVRLREGAIPTLFKLPPHLIKTITHRKPPTERTPLADVTDTGVSADVAESSAYTSAAAVTLTEAEHSYVTRDSR